MQKRFNHTKPKQKINCNKQIFKRKRIIDTTKKRSWIIKKRRNKWEFTANFEFKSILWKFIEIQDWKSRYENLRYLEKEERIDWK